MAKFDFGGFVRECYLRSEPSVDLDEVTADNPVNCSKHRLSTDEYKRILVEYGVADENWNPIDGNRDRLTGCNMWCLQSGPQLYDPKAA